jgi:hypothetical protein
VRRRSIRQWLWHECSSPRGRRELLNLECSINYDFAGASSRHGKGKVQVFQRGCLGLRAFGVLWVRV